MKRSTKKGFTIVELVIVIAIIAILAAVLIPTFASLIQKANESKDTQLVKNLNTALAADNKEHKTMQDALDAAVAFGYDVGKINASATNKEILWDSKNDVFCYYDTNTKTPEYIPETSLKNGAVAENETYKLWKIYTEAPTEQTFSIYWNSDKAFDKELTVGFDAGNNTATTALTYKGVGTKQDVVIRTNGGTLTVNAPADTVNHYGYATVVTVTEVAKESYHENGKVDEIKLAKGRVVVESDGEVGSVMVTASAAAHVKVENKSGKLGGVAASNSDVVSNLKNQVTGVDESKVLNKAVDNSKFAGGLGTEDAPYLIATADQFKSIADYSDSMKNGNAMAFKLISDIDFSSVEINSDYVCNYFCGNFDGGNNILVVNDSINGIFGDAVGNTVFSNIKLRLFNNPVKLCAGMNASSSTNLTLDNIEIDTFVKNGNVELGQNTGLFVDATGYDAVEKKWCDTYRNSIVISNCKGYANITAESYNAVFIGAMLNNTDATVKDCTYYGQYYGESVNLVQGNTCSDAGKGWITCGKSVISIENVNNSGAIYGTTRAALIAGGNGTKEASEHTTIKNCSIGTTRALTDATLGVSLSENKNVVISKATAELEYYVLTFVGGKRRVSETSENSSYRFSIKIEAPTFDAQGKMTTTYKLGKLVTVEQYKAIDSTASFTKGNGTKLYSEDGAEYWVTEYNGTTYYVFSFDNDYYRFESGEYVPGPVDINKVLVTIYDAEGKPIAQKDCPTK